MSAYDRQTYAFSSGTTVHVRKRIHPFIVLQCIIIGFVLSAGYLALYWFLERRTPATDLLGQAWRTAFPQLQVLYYWSGWPRFVYALDWFDFLRGRQYGLLIALGGMMVLVVWAALLAKRQGRLLVTGAAQRPLLYVLIFFALVFTLIMVLAPVQLSVFSQDMVLSGLFGRMVERYHLNPYLTDPATLTGDNISVLLKPGQNQLINAVPFGPVWMDISILVALVAQSDIAHMVLWFRGIGAVAHLFNALLIWTLLSASRPQLRAAATLFYAWNPLPLVLGVMFVHQEMVLLLCLLLAVFGLQRGTTMLGWVFALLAILMNLMLLLILPLFLRLSIRSTRRHGWLWRSFWFLSMCIVSVLVVGLAYVPYWQGWSIWGIGQYILKVFWQSQAINSLDAAALHLPLALPEWVKWLVMPQVWSVAALVVTVVYLLFLLWLTDTFEAMVQAMVVVLLLWVCLQPLYWPWYMLVPLGLALYPARRDTILAVFLLCTGALLIFAFWYINLVWSGQGLLTIGVPIVIWGWLLFFIATWQMMQSTWNRVTMHQESRPMKLIRPPWLTRPSWPSRSGRRGRRY